MAGNRNKIAASKVSHPSPDESAHVLPGSELDALIDIANERTGYLEQMRAAMLSGDDVQLKLYARKLCGLSSESQPEPSAKRKGDPKHGKK